MSKLLELAERCEAARGPDKRLGAEIEIAVRGFPNRAFSQRNSMRPRGSPELDRLEWASEWLGAGPTASIDAAITLVPAGMLCGTANAGGMKTGVIDLTRATATVGLPDEVASPVEAASLALAITAAALRARAAQDSQP